MPSPDAGLPFLACDADRPSDATLISALSDPATLHTMDELTAFFTRRSSELPPHEVRQLTTVRSLCAALKSQSRRSTLSPHSHPSWASVTLLRL